MKMRKVFPTIILTIFGWLFFTVMCQAVINASEKLPFNTEVTEIVRGKGFHFELVNSTYINVSLSSSESVNVVLMSIPEIILIYFEGSSSDKTTKLTIGGFKSQTNYYKYEDNYHNLDKIITDKDGRYT